MNREDDLKGFGLSSEQYDEDQVQEVDSRSVDDDELREHAKDPDATWSQDTPTGKTGDAEGDHDTADPGETAATTHGEDGRPA